MTTGDLIPTHTSVWTGHGNFVNDRRDMTKSAPLVYLEHVNKMQWVKKAIQFDPEDISVGPDGVIV